VLGGEHHVRRAVERVGARREDADRQLIVVLARIAIHRLGRRVVRRDRELDLRADAAADPVALHLLERLRPLQVVEVVDEPVGVRGDAQHPLAHRPALDRKPADLALAVDDFLVGQHGAQTVAPVHRRFVDVRQPLAVDDVALLV
jgi:hypothetical protein